LDAVSEIQMEALTEIFNIGAGRGASSLSAVVASPVRLSVPRIDLYRVADLDVEVLGIGSERLGAVLQSYSGPFDAQAMLLFPEENSLEILRDMLGGTVSIEELTELEQETMCEVGNIILNACLSAMADVLGVSFAATLPTYAIDTLDTLIGHSLKSNEQPLMLVLNIDMVIEKRNTRGFLAFLLSYPSLDMLMSHIDRFLGKL
jgi:chemotaxis protein CheC